MKNTKLLSLMAAISLSLGGLASADSAKSYQVTGPVLEMNDNMIAVQKGKDRWEIVRDSSSKVPADVKVGDKVTITYTMTAQEVEVKTGKAAKTSAQKKETK
jgi:co-chaperonin GroES (HSP10)